MRANERHCQYTISQSSPRRMGQRHEGDCCSNGFLILQRTVSRVVVIVFGCCSRELLQDSKLRSSRALAAAGHPGHLISFVETDLEAYSLSIYSYRGVGGRTRDCRTCACGGVCAKDAMRCDATRTPPWPCRCDALQSCASQLSGTRMRESHCSHQTPSVHIATKQLAMLARCAGCPAARVSLDY
jgi:hypothetical protein